MALYQLQLHLLRTLATFSLSVFLCQNLFCVNAAPLISSEKQAAMYLQKYGYMNETSSMSAAHSSHQSISLAIRDFQRFAGLADTGVLDNNTLAMMNMPRCGVRDKMANNTSNRRKRYALQGSKWLGRYLTYRISKYTPKLPDKRRVNLAIARAFQVWSDVTNMKFLRSPHKRVDIEIRFEKGYHGHDGAFDGPSGTLAHAFFPKYGGDAHFDEDEAWTINEPGTSFFQVAAHEFGHSLGLSHSRVNGAVMYPMYTYRPYFRLHLDDITGIQALYGRKGTFRDDEAPNLCEDASIDTAVKTLDGSVYVFKGDYYWELQGDAIAEGYPRKIAEDWPGLQGGLDAAFTWPQGHTMFFKGDSYWRFENKVMRPGYPREISAGFPGIPNNIDAAFTWNGNNKTYFFKGSAYWKYDDQTRPQVDPGYPYNINLWEGVPYNIDAALQWTGNKTFFFKGGSYYRYDDITEKVDDVNPTYPRPTSVWWFNCKDDSNSGDSSIVSESESDQKSIYDDGFDSMQSVLNPAKRNYESQNMVDRSEGKYMD